MSHAAEPEAAPAIFVSTGACFELPMVDVLTVIADAGADGVELLMVPELDHFSEVQIAWWFEGYEGRRNLHAPFRMAEVSSPKRREECRRVAELAGGIGAKLLVLHPAVSADPAIVDSETQAAVETLRQWLPDDCPVTLENLPAPESSDVRHGLADPDRVAALARACGCRLTLDTTHLATADLRILESHKRHADLIANVHLSDYAEPHQHLLPGRGELPLRQYLHFVGRSPSPPCVTVEAAAQHVADAGKALRWAVSYVREGLA